MIIEKIEGVCGPLFIYEDILCMPAQKLLVPWEGVHFKGGPVWPNWEDEPIVRYFVNNGRPMDTIPDIVEPEESIEELVAWGGAIHQHFGHFVADVCIPRVIPILAEFPNITFIFIAPPNLELKPWMKEIFDYFDIKNYILIKKPTLVRKLIAGPQIERLYSGLYDYKYLDSYLDYLDLLAEKKIKSLPGETYEKVFI